jgi:hypothetical protein
MLQWLILGMMHGLASKYVNKRGKSNCMAGGTYNVKESRFKKLVLVNYPTEVEYHAYCTITVKLEHHAMA